MTNTEMLKEMIRLQEEYDQWQNGQHGYKEMIDRLESLTGLAVED